MRANDIEAFIYPSARAKDSQNLGVINPNAFAKNEPVEQKTWSAFVSQSHIEFSNPLMPQIVAEFAVEQFLIEGQLPFVTKTIQQSV